MPPKEKKNEPIPPVAPRKERVYELGLVLSGTVSSGAYTAGVIDFLIFALNEWESQKDRDIVAGKRTVPDHKVKLKVVSGNSGGALTACLIPGAVLGEFESFSEEAERKKGVANDAGQAIDKGLRNRFYDSWVRRIDMKRLLNNSDLNALKDSDKIRSILNSGVVDEIARDFAKVDRRSPALRPSWLDDDLEFYFSVTNLTGVPYNISFHSGVHGMTQHADYQHYVMSFREPPQSTSECKAISLDESRFYDQDDPNWLQFKEAAIASGSFPVVLEARAKTRPVADYLARPFLVPTAINKRRGDENDMYIAERKHHTYETATVKPSWIFTENDSRKWLLVDGGMVNNDPLEFARTALTRNGRKTLASVGEQANQSIVMVSPLNGLPGNVCEDESLFSVLKSVIPTFLNISRFKLSELALAQNKDVYSRYLISPSDRNNCNGQPYKYPSYCALLGAFAGFFSEDLRHHDYLLGQYNCQRFLLEHFDLPVTNPIMHGYSKDGFSAHSTGIQSYENANGRKVKKEHFRIIPLVGEAANLLPCPPRLTGISDKILQDEELQNLLKERFRTLANKFAKDFDQAPAQGKVASIVRRIAAISNLPLIKFLDVLEDNAVEKLTEMIKDQLSDERLNETVPIVPTAP